MIEYIGLAAAAYYLYKQNAPAAPTTAPPPVATGTPDEQMQNAITTIMTSPAYKAYRDSIKIDFIIPVMPNQTFFQNLKTAIVYRADLVFQKAKSILPPSILPLINQDMYAYKYPKFIPDVFNLVGNGNSPLYNAVQPIASQFQNQALGAVMGNFGGTGAKVQPFNSTPNF